MSSKCQMLRNEKILRKAGKIRIKYLPRERSRYVVPGNKQQVSSLALVRDTTPAAWNASLTLECLVLTFPIFV